MTVATASARDRAATDVVFADVFEDWDRITRGDPPSLTIMTPQTLHFTATYTAAPFPCNASELQTIMASLGSAGLPAPASVTGCIEIADNGRHASLFVGDALMKKLLKANVGGRLDVRARLLAYRVGDRRDRNAPVLLADHISPIETARPSTPRSRARAR